MTQPITAFGLRPVSDGQGGTRLEFGPMPAPRYGGKGQGKSGGKRNAPAPIKPTPNAENLRLFLERLERLHEEKKGVADDIRDVMSEAKSQGYDARQIERIRKIRLMDPNDRAEADAILETYMINLGLA
jgi:uncharacterized protein (UPF0335 family)